MGGRIAILCHGGGGGSTRAAMDLAAALARRGAAVLLLTLGRPAWRPPAGVDHVVLRAARPRRDRLDRPWADGTVAALAREVDAICRRERVALLHFHYAFPFAAVAARLGPSGPAVIGTLHGSDVTAAADPATATGLARDLARAAAVTTVSEAYGRLLRRHLDRAAPVVVPNFVAPGRAMGPGGGRSRPGGPPTLLHVSSFRAVKDARAIARVFLAVRRQIRCRLVLVGDGPQAGGLRALLRARARDVRLLGFRPEVAPLLRQADVFLLASRAESFGLAALEAMTAGVPVVAPAVGGLPEVVGPGGVLFAPGRVAAAAAAIVALLHDPVRRRRIAVAARRAAARFDADAILDRWEALYAAALTHPRAVPAGAAR
ncbi:MAG: glycosyltransferase [Alphaproteobacteria bacterium]